MELKEVDLDEYYKKRVDGDDIISKYVTSYESIETDRERINFTANLASLKAEFSDQQEIEDRNIEYRLSKLKSKICEFAGVTNLDLDIGELVLLPPDPVKEEDDIEEVTRAFIVGLEYFVDMLRYAPLKASFALNRLNEIHDILLEKCSGRSIDFRDLQLIVKNSIKRTATFQHQKVLLELTNRIPLENYSVDLPHFDKWDAGIGQRNEKETTYEVIENVAKDIASKGSSNHSEKTIIAYLKKFVEKPGLSRRARKEECLSEAEAEEVKADFIERATDATVGAWETRLEEEKAKIKDYRDLLN